MKSLEEKKKQKQIYNINYRNANKEKLALYRKVNEERIKAQDKLYNLANKDKRKAYRDTNKQNLKNKYYQREYGITLEDYNEMFEEQGGKCKICNIHQLELPKALAVDHCHETTKVRGLLCMNCNILLGKAKDNKELLLKAIEYLENN